ncbi:unnamed protein product [Dicrocoelium dendriticum]|nr:unnamed protein product [Dicrocoelium dendriticum]
MSVMIPGEHTTNSADSLFQIRTSTTESDVRSFQQRQSDVFSSLASLEAAHVEVTKATKDMRDAVRRAAWRHTTTAPENLAAEKKRRDDSTSASRPRDSLALEDNFRRPKVPLARRQKGGGTQSLRRDPLKWTHYSLADVDEDGSAGQGGDPNFAIASSFISSLRERQAVAYNLEEDDGSDANTKAEHRVLFRPVRGSKRSRMEEREPQPSAVQCVALSAAQSEEITECSDTSELRTSILDTAASEVFLYRRRRPQIRDRTGDDTIDSLDEPTKSPEGLMQPNFSSSEEDISEDLIENFLA